MKLVEVSHLIQGDRSEDRCFLWIRHATVVAARSLGLYVRNKDYTFKEAKSIHREVKRLFPGRRRR